MTGTAIVVKPLYRIFVLVVQRVSEVQPEFAFKFKFVTQKSLHTHYRPKHDTNDDNGNRRNPKPQSHIK